MSRILDKPAGFRRSPAQIARNMEAMARLRAGKLEPGEIFRTVTGLRSPRRETQRVPTRATCIDCGKSLVHEGGPYLSQPRRCRPCGKEKRQSHHKAAMTKRDEEIEARKTVAEEPKKRSRKKVMK